jgi:hypothetical protein
MQSTDVRACSRVCVKPQKEHQWKGRRGVCVRARVRRKQFAITVGDEREAQMPLCQPKQKDKEAVGRDGSSWYKATPLTHELLNVTNKASLKKEVMKPLMNARATGREKRHSVRTCGTSNRKRRQQVFRRSCIERNRKVKDRRQHHQLEWRGLCSSPSFFRPHPDPLRLSLGIEKKGVATPACVSGSVSLLISFVKPFLLPYLFSFLFL